MRLASAPFWRIVQHFGLLRYTLNRHDLHLERAPERDGTAPSEMSGCLPEAMRETGK